MSVAAFDRASAQQSPQIAPLAAVPAVTSNSPPGAKPLLASEFNHDFFDRENLLLFSAVGVSRVLDYASTKNMLARGREEELIPDDVVYNNAGFASLEAAGVATSIGVSYLLHRTGHHKLERWMSIGHITVTTFGAARNYSLKTRHP